MQREVAYTSELTKVRHTTYVRNSRAIAAVWGIFTVCYAILNIIAFLQPQWVGDTGEGMAGFFGLYERCSRTRSASDYTCKGDFMEFSSILNDSLRAASLLVGFSALFFIFSIICILLFFFLKAATVLRICGWLQVLGALCMAVGCILFPNGWDADEFDLICGNQNETYNLGNCGIRWAYILSIVLILDAFILATLAFVLAAKQARLLPEHAAKGEINHAYVMTSEKQALGPTVVTTERQYYTQDEKAGSDGGEDLHL